MEKYGAINRNALEEGISKYIFSNSGLIWPTPGYTTITSYFGYRKSPISGASSYHNGIDIGAPSGSEIIAAFSGQVTYIGFYGAGRRIYPLPIPKTGTAAAYA